MDLPEFLTFDCYGTLTDFAIERVALEQIQDRTSEINIDDFLRDYEEIRFQAVLGDYKPYSDILRETLEAAMNLYGLEYRPEDGEAIVAAVPGFGPFPDTTPVLTELSKHCKLVIISNTEDHLIAGNVEKIGVPFHRVVTAEQARAYKPTKPAFDYLLSELGAEPSDLIHVAQGFNYDIMPAHDMGWRRVWINRTGRAGDPAYGPYHEMPDLTGLPALLGLA